MGEFVSRSEKKFGIASACRGYFWWSLMAFLVPDGRVCFPDRKKIRIASACRGVLLVVPDGLFGPGWEGLFPEPKKNLAELPHVGGTFGGP